LNNHKKKKVVKTKESENSPKNKNKQNFWDDGDTSSDLTYPQLGDVSFSSFLKKVTMGLGFSFLPAIIFSVFGNNDLFYTWGIATFIVSGIYFLAAGKKDLSHTSARKSYESYEKTKKYSKNSDQKFKFELGLFKFGSIQEDIGAAICLLGIGAIFLNLVA